MQSNRSSRWQAVMALVWIVLAVSQTAVALRRDSVVDWLLAAGLVVLAAAFVARWGTARRRSGSTS